MKIVFIGPPSLTKDGGVQFPATLDSHPLLCYSNYEVLEDVDPSSEWGNSHQSESFGPGFKSLTAHQK